MIRCVVRRLHSPDVDLDVYAPEDPNDVGILVQIMAGPADGPGEESFDVVVCTLRWLERLVHGEELLIGRHYLIMSQYNTTKVQNYLTQQVESMEAPTWSDLALKVGRIGKWEFEDYQS